jgi:hypothetical protein
MRISGTLDMQTSAHYYFRENYLVDYYGNNFGAPGAYKIANLSGSIAMGQNGLPPSEWLWIARTERQQMS